MTNTLLLLINFFLLKIFKFFNYITPHIVIYFSTRKNKFSFKIYIHVLCLLNNKDLHIQCPPTIPGLKLIKFHFVEAAFNTLEKSIFNLLKSIDSSFINAILISLFECFQ